MNEPTATPPTDAEPNEPPAAPDGPSTGDGAAPADAPEGIQDGAGNRADGAVTVRPGGQENARRAGRADLRRARERAERAAEALDAVRTAAREITSMQDAIPASMDSEHIRAMNTALRAALRSIESDVRAASGAVQDAEREQNEVLNRLDFRIPNDLPF